MPSSLEISEYRTHEYSHRACHARQQKQGACRARQQKQGIGRAAHADMNKPEQHS